MKNLSLKNKIGYGALASFILIQFFQIDKSNPGVVVGQDIGDASSIPDEVHTHLQNACYDCHSHEVEYPWYTYVQPVGWWIKGHINHGSESLNFSEWGALNSEDRKHKAHEIVEEVEALHMPPKGYVRMHGEADLSEDQQAQLRAWFEKVSQ